MSQFSRRAKWLNALFPASVLPQASDPGVVSDDVSLVQQYDGGSWPIPAIEDWFFGPFISVAGATGSTQIFQVPEDQVLRIFSIHVFTVINNQAPAAPIISPDLTGGVLINDPVITDPVAQGTTCFPLNRAIVAPPGSFIRGDHFGGSPTTQLSWSMYGCLAPLGSVFSC